MYKTLFLGVVITSCAHVALAQDKIYRCGNEYTNDSSQAHGRNCKLIEGGNVTVVKGTRPAAANTGAGGRSAGTSSHSAASASTSPPKTSTAEQRARESDARMILDSELRKAETRKAELQREYNNGEPQKTTNELVNQALYNQRVANLKSELTRVDSDISGIQRELSRLPTPSN